MASSFRRWLRPALLFAAALAILVLTLPVTLTPGVRARLTAALGERFDSEVELESLRVSVLPRMRVAGRGLVLRHQGRADTPPLITIAAFSAEANLFGLLGRPLRLSRVRLDRLEINVPPGGMALGEGEDPAGAGGPTGDGEPNEDQPDEERADEDRAGGGAREAAGPAPGRSPLVVGELLSERAVLRILRSEPEKPPRLFEIAHLAMRDVGADRPWAFEATLTNPTPPGEIGTRGTFGPWHAARPSATPMNARYEFRDADLGVFDGIQGILNSKGSFEGVLDRIEVTGEADVPAFALDAVGTPVPLATTFRATVDGTNGNTWLKPVEARLARSPIQADGGVVEADDEEGRTISLDVVMADARIEDVLRLAVKASRPPLTGALKLETKLVLPPGDADAIEKLRLDGSFQVASARFTTGTVQAKVNELSQKARGDDDDDDEAPDRVVSDFQGRFTMRGGVIRFSTVSFAVPGAKVDLAGSYTLRSEALDFRGTVRLDAKLSELTTGVKSVLLRLVDPLVRRRNVTVIPVTIRGTPDEPDFGVDLRRAFTPG